MNDGYAWMESYFERQAEQLLRPSDFLTPSSYLEWARETGTIPFRLKHQTRNDLPTRWQSCRR